MELRFGFHQHSRLGCRGWLHVQGTLRGDSAANGLVSLQDEGELVLFLLQLLDLLLQRLLLALPQVHLLLQCLRLVNSPLSTSRSSQLVPLPPHPYLLVSSLLPCSPSSPPPVCLLAAGAQSWGAGGARCHHCGHPSLLPVRRVHVDVRLVLQCWGSKACLVLVTLRLLHVDEHLLDRLEGGRGECVGGVGRVQRHVTPQVLLTHNLDSSCHLLFLSISAHFDSSAFSDSPISTPM